MAPSATSPPPTSTASAVNGVPQPPSDVVRPPKDIQEIVEKTAGYVARNGPVFEERIRVKETANPKFSFLTPGDSYFAFYAWRLEEIRAGRGTATSAGRANDASATQNAKPKGLQEPPPFKFSARMPNINAQDLDVIRLTALFVAKNGRPFQTKIAQREGDNSQFYFLRSNHSLHNFFSQLVDQYAELLNTRGAEDGKSEEQRIKEIDKLIENKFHLLTKGKQRAEWVQYQEKQKVEKEEELEAEKVAYAQVDWHDFVVVETVDFTEADDHTDLPPPTSLNDLQSASLDQKAMMSLQPSNMRIEEAMPTDDMDYAYQNPYQQQQQAQPPLPPPQQYPQYPQQTQPQYQQSMPPPSNLPPLEHNRLDPIHQTASRPTSTPGQPINIRSDYVPRAAANRRAQGMGICPNCHSQIPYAELEEHMRIELLDPRWKEQRAKSDARQSTTNLSPADMANNLKRLASQRGDVFDSGAEVVSDEENARRKRVALGYDGVAPVGGVGGMAAQGVGVNIEEQIRHIKEKSRSTQ